MRTRYLALVAAAVVLAGGIGEASAQKVGNASVSLSTEAAAAATGNPAFDLKYLTAWINNRLASDGLRVGNAAHTLDVVVRQIRIPSEAGDDQIVGDAVVKDRSGTVVDRFEVSASSAFSGAKEVDKERMPRLYTEFSKRLANELRRPSSPLFLQPHVAGGAGQPGGSAKPTNPDCAPWKTVISSRSPNC